MGKQSQKRRAKREGQPVASEAKPPRLPPTFDEFRAKPADEAAALLGITLGAVYEDNNREATRYHKRMGELLGDPYPDDAQERLEWQKWLQIRSFLAPKVVDAASDQYAKEALQRHQETNRKRAATIAAKKQAKSQ